MRGTYEQDLRQTFALAWILVDSEGAVFDPAWFTVQRVCIARISSIRRH